MIILAVMIMAIKLAKLIAQATSMEPVKLRKMVLHPYMIKQ